MLDNWPQSCHVYDRHLSCYNRDRPAIGICFDVGRMSSGKYGMKCWEIFWRSVEPQLIAGSSLLEGSILESDGVYCLGFQNDEAWRLESVVTSLEKSEVFLDVCASPGLLIGESVTHEPLVHAGEVNEAGRIIGISYNARLALNQVKRERMDASPPDSRHAEAMPGPCAADPAARAQSPDGAYGRLKKLWRAWKQ